MPEITDTAKRIYTETKHESAGIWYISDKYGSKILIKTLSTTIKALIKGCKIELVFGKDLSRNPNVFHTGLKVYDDPVNYQIICGTHRFLDEHLSITKIMHLEKVQVQIVNELNTHQVFGDLVLPYNARHDILALLGNPKYLYTGAFDNEICSSLDRFQAEITAPKNGEATIDITCAECRIIDFNPIVNSYIHSQGKTNTIITDVDEGHILEKEVFVVLESLFKESIFLNPTIPHKNQKRELTDIFGFSQYGIFLIETKALGINSSSERTMDRKVSGIKNQIEKAASQLAGAAKKISKGTPIYDSMGNEIVFDRTILPHGIILVSELLQFGDWDELIPKILKAVLGGKIWIQVMELKEFMRFVGYSFDNKNRLDYLLMQRFENFVKEPSIFTQTQFVDREDPEIET